MASGRGFWRIRGRKGRGWFGWRRNKPAKSIIEDMQLEQPHDAAPLIPGLTAFTK
jgi:hypothetical protein